MMDRGEFERFYAETVPRLESFVHRLTRAAGLTEEIVQETFYRFLRSGFRGASDEERRRYLYRIAMNLMKTHWRRERLAPAAVEEPAGMPDATLEISQLLDRLSPKDRALLWLAYAEGCSHEEVSQVLGVGAASVRVLLSRAKKRFLSLWKGER